MPGNEPYLLHVVPASPRPVQDVPLGAASKTRSQPGPASCRMFSTHARNSSADIWPALSSDGGHGPAVALVGGASPSAGLAAAPGSAGAAATRGGSDVDASALNECDDARWWEGRRAASSGDAALLPAAPADRGGGRPASVGDVPTSSIVTSLRLCRRGWRAIAMDAVGDSAASAGGVVLRTAGSVTGASTACAHKPKRDARRLKPFGTAPTSGRSPR